MATTFRPLTPQDIDAFEMATPVDSRGIPQIPDMTDAELAQELERVEAAVQSPPEGFVPSSEDWSEAMDAFGHFPLLAA